MSMSSSTKFRQFKLSPSVTLIRHQEVIDSSGTVLYEYDDLIIDHGGSVTEIKFVGTEFTKQQLQKVIDAF